MFSVVVISPAFSPLPLRIDIFIDIKVHFSSPLFAFFRPFFLSIIFFQAGARRRRHISQFAFSRHASITLSDSFFRDADYFSPRHADYRFSPFQFIFFSCSAYAVISIPLLRFSFHCRDVFR